MSDAEREQCRCRCWTADDMIVTQFDPLCSTAHTVCILADGQPELVPAMRKASSVMVRQHADDLMAYDLDRWDARRCWR